MLNVINNNHQGNHTHWMRDTAPTISAAASQCAATPDCPLHEATAEAVEKRLFNIFESFRTKVATVYDGETMVHVDRSPALVSLLFALEFPYTLGMTVFDALTDLEKGGGLKFYNFAKYILGNATVTCRDCQPLTVAHAGNELHARAAIQCSDSGPISDDLASLRGVYDSLSARRI
jgi:hypothetical protein